MVYKQRFNPGAQFGLLILFIVLGMILSSIVAGLIGNQVLNVDLQDLASTLMKPENTQISRVLQIITSFLIMGMPALAVGIITGHTPIEFLGFRSAGSAKQLAMVTLMVFAGLIFSGGLGELNRIIPIKKEWATYFQSLEDNYNSEVLSMSKMQNTYDFIVSLFVLALIPAIFEEMLFRGALQQITISLVRNAFLGILITSIIFSAIHGSYYGFLPRLFLSIMLGYIFYYSKNIWLNITAHFLNNAYALSAMYSLSREGKLTSESMNETYPLYYILIGGVILFALFIVFKKESVKFLPAPVITKEINTSA